MKKIRCLFLVINVVLPFLLTAQSVNFYYDDSGNRVQREIIYLKGGSGNEAFSSATSGTEKSPDTSAIEWKIEKTDIMIMPNPNQGRFTIHFTNLPENIVTTSVSIFSASGIRVYDQENVSEEMIIDLSAQENGLYLLEIILGQNKEVWKIIKE